MTAGEAFQKFCETVKALRDQDRGCQWMIDQTHESLRRYMIEEAYEAVDAINSGDPKKIADELGDVLLQVVLNSQIAAENKEFVVQDAIASIDAKMRRRHPHVFETGERRRLSVAEIEERYEKIKAAEKAAQPKVKKGFFAEAAKVHPALQQGFAIGKQAKKIQFDWATPEEVLAQFESEVKELKDELTAKNPDTKKIAEELSDVYFSLVQLTRHLQLDPETVAMDGNRKFLDRFAAMEKIAAARGIDIQTQTTAELEKLWQEAKQKKGNGR